MVIDVIFMVAAKGGFENALNRTADYLTHHNCKVRFIQIINTFYDWASKNVDFTCLDMDHDLVIQDCIDKYSDYIRKNGAPDIVFATGIPTVICIAKTAICNLGITGCPTVAWPHNDLLFYNSNLEQTGKELEFADMVFAISNKIASDVQKLCPGKLIYRINNTISTDKICFSDNRSGHELACVGRITREKNLSLTLKAISLAKTSWKLKIIGEGDAEDYLHSLCSQYGITDKVHFFGWSDDPWGETAGCRALVMSSLDNTEGFPLVALEAIACGMPVISNPIGPLCDLIIPGVSGYVYQSGTAEELADYLDSLYDSDYSPEAASACRDSIIDYMPQVALWDFLCKTVASSRLVGLPQRNWNDKGRMLVKDKLSVTLTDLEKNFSSMSSLLNKLSEQTMEPNCLEIIIVCQSMDPELQNLISSFEKDHTDNTIIVNCNPLENMDAAIDVALQYASGRIVSVIPDETVIKDKYYLEEVYFDKLF